MNTGEFVYSSPDQDDMRRKDDLNEDIHPFNPNNTSEFQRDDSYTEMNDNDEVSPKNSNMVSKIRIRFMEVLHSIISKLKIGANTAMKSIKKVFKRKDKSIAVEEICKNAQTDLV